MLRSLLSAALRRQGQIRYPTRCSSGVNFVVWRSCFTGIYSGPSERKPSLLMATFDADLQQKVIGEARDKKFKLRNIDSEISYMESWGYPMPKELTEEQWKRLLQFETREARVKYIDSIASGQEEELLLTIKEEDELLLNGITFTVEMFKDLVPEMSPRKLEEQVLLLNQIYQGMLEMGETVPVNFSPVLLRELISMNFPNRIEGTLKHFGEMRQTKLREMIKKKANAVAGKEKKALVRAARENENHISYGLGNNTMMLFVYEATMTKWQQWKVIREHYEWGQPLVFDLAFLSQMAFKQVKSIVYRELMYAAKTIRMAKEPFQIHFCNYNPECPKMRMLEEFVPNIRDPSYYINLTEKSYMDLFPKEKLVYLTSDSNNILSKFNSDDIYIIGALHDGGDRNNRPLTLSKAKELGIRHAKLPIAEYLGFSAELNVETVASIVSDVKNTGDWFYSCRWVPSRYVRNKLTKLSGNKEFIRPRDEAYYKAHFDLHPATHESYIQMSPAEYRKKYMKIVSSEIPDSKTIKEESRPKQQKTRTISGKKLVEKLFEA